MMETSEKDSALSVLNLIASLSRDRHLRAAGIPVSQREIRLDGISVLLVDDSADNRMLVELFLKTAGASVATAKNGQEALLKLKEAHYNAVLMDIQMPVMDGYEATAQLRREGNDIPIVALTAHAMKEERKRCLQSGFNAHLGKPIDRQELLRQLAAISYSAGRGSGGDSLY